MILITGGYLTFYLPGQKSPLEIHLEEPTSLLKIVDNLKIPPAEIFLTTINGQLVELVLAVVEENDEVRILSAVDGG